MANLFVKDVVCLTCGERYPHGTLFPCRKCGGFMDVEYDYGGISDALTRSTIKGRGPTLWKYRELLPLKTWDNIVSLGEGGTPLVRCGKVNKIVGVEDLYVKDEGRNPTGSFKDRNASVIVSLAVENKIGRVLTASSGNESAALGCYCSRAGIRALAFVHSYDQSNIKLSQTRFYGIVIGMAPEPPAQVEYFWQNSQKKDTGGSFFGSGKFWEVAYEYGWYPSTAAPINPYHKEGYKTIAYEVCEQLEWSPPDFVVIPTGSGDNLAAEWKAFKELKSLGLTNALPRIIATQESTSKKLSFKDFSGHSLARKSVEESRGEVVGVTSEEEKEHLMLLATKEGLLFEPLAAQPMAATRTLSDDGTISRKDVVVCIGTGNGIKYPGLASSLTVQPTEVDASLSGMLAFLRSQETSGSLSGHEARTLCEASLRSKC